MSVCGATCVEATNIHAPDGPRTIHQAKYNSALVRDVAHDGSKLRITKRAASLFSRTFPPCVKPCSAVRRKCKHTYTHGYVMARGLQAYDIHGITPNTAGGVYTDFYNRSLTTPCKTVTAERVASTLRVLNVISCTANEIAT